MTRIGWIAVALLLSALASAPARADFTVLVWKSSKMCQIWNNAGGPRPVGNYVVVAKTQSWEAAVDALNNVTWSRQCW